MFNQKSTEIVKETILFMGDAQVGKTSIIKRFINEEFDEKYNPTVEDVYIKQFEINGWCYSIDFLDTSGRYTFPAMRRLNINKATCFVLMFSMTSTSSLETLSQIWNDIVQEKDLSFIATHPIVIVANKSDFVSQLEISEYAAQEWVEEKSIPLQKLIICSAKNENGVWDIFQSLWEQKVKLKTHLKDPFKSNIKSYKKMPEISLTLLQMGTNKHLNPSQRRFSAFAGFGEPKSPNKKSLNFLKNNSHKEDDRRSSRPSISKFMQARGSKVSSRSSEIVKLDCIPS